ncbi:restriction endonuclease subunit S [Helicobacter sp. 23-1046]
MREYCDFVGYDYDEFRAFMGGGDLAQNLAQNEVFKDYKSDFDSTKPKVFKKVAIKESDKKDLFEQSSFFMPDLSPKESKQALHNFEKSTEFKEATKAFYVKQFLAQIRHLEQEKMLYYALICDEKVLVLKSPNDKNTQNKSNKANIVKFLGYDWSKRKGDEGIKYQTTTLENDELKEGKDDSDEEKKSKEALRNINSVKYISTPLYNPNDKEDKSKLAFGIKSFIRAQEQDLDSQDIHSELEAILSNLQSKEADSYSLFVSDIKSMLDFTRAEFSKAISLNPATQNSANNLFENSKFEMVRLGEAIAENPKSKIQVNQVKENTKGKYPFYTSGLNIYRYDEALISGENIFLSTGGNALVQFYDGESAYSTDTYAIKSRNENEFFTKFIYLLLENITPIINEFYFKGMGLKHLQKTEFKNIKIPKPPLEIQRQIISECESVESQSQHIKDLIALYRDLISAILNKCGISDTHPLTPSAREGEIRGESSAIKGESMPSLRESRSDSWQSTNTDLLIESLLSQITTLQSNLDFKILPTPKSPSCCGRGLDLSFVNDTPPQTSRLRGGAYFDSSLAESPLSLSPSLAEGVRGWVQSPDSSLRGNEMSVAIHTDCHTDPEQSEGEVSKNPQNRDISAFSKPQYDKNIDCHDLTASNLAMTDLLKSLPTPPKQGWDKVALSNGDIFELTIGERVLDSELHEQGKIPVYSANVTKPFGFINKELLEKLGDYDRDSVLWGIDGDFMIGFVPKNTPFYPTDHCGVLRIKDKSTNMRIAGFGLENEGRKFGFSRNLRASISRIKSLKIPLPPLREQEKIIACIESIESKISALDSTLPALERTKSQILQKYL